MKWITKLLKKICPYCKGGGTTAFGKCPMCRGTGQLGNLNLKQ